MKNYTCPFGSHLNFLDPQTTDDGQPYAPIRYRELVKECYVISKNINTSYTEVLKTNPTERHYLIDFLVEEAKEREQEIARRKAEREANKNTTKR